MVITLGDRVKARRKRSRLSLAQAAAKLGRDKSWLSRVENGIVHPRYDDLEELAAALGCAVRDLVPPKRRNGRAA